MRVMNPLNNQEGQRLKRIFAGKNAKYLWKTLDKVKDEKIGEALYTLAMNCDDLEDQVHKLEKRLAKLEGY